ncbi:MAG: peptidoglycan recognition family protein [Elainella sp.]
MRSKLSLLGTFVSLVLLVLLLGIRPGYGQSTAPAPSLRPPLPLPALAPTDSVPLGCAIQPERNRSGTTPIRPRPTGVPLSRFRQVAPAASTSASTSASAMAKAPAYQPREVVELADPTNFGERYIQDLNGRLADHAPIIVLHETVGSARSAINYFQTPHPRDDDQVSYHTLIGLDGTVYYLVPPDKRAFGAGNSVFAGPNGEESVQTNPEFPPSVNNFAYHISLETPADGDNNGSSHSGYTSAQYQSLAWLVAKTSVPSERITYHKIVDRSHSRQDPRSFNAQTFLRLLDSYPKTAEITIGCSLPTRKAG